MYKQAIYNGQINENSKGYPDPPKIPNVQRHSNIRATLITTGNWPRDGNLEISIPQQCQWCWPEIPTAPVAISVLSQDYPTFRTSLTSHAFNLSTEHSFYAEKCQEVSHRFLPDFPRNQLSSFGWLTSQFYPGIGSL